MQQETITYGADGLNLRGCFFAQPGATALPAVLVFPEAFGIGDHVLGKARRLAEAGFAALACDLHGDGKLIDDLQEAVGLIQPLLADPSRTRARAHAALEALTGRPEVDANKVAAIGFCFGGTMALELARGGADLRAVVGFHSELATKAPKTDARAIRGKVLACIGADDPMIPADQRAEFEAEMRDAGVDWQMHLYGGVVHSFTNTEAAKRGMPDAIRYSAEADARSWEAMDALFSEVLV